MIGSLAFFVRNKEEQVLRQFVILLAAFSFLFTHPEYGATTENEPATITQIFPLDAWETWLIGYIIHLNDDSVWFSERGPLDYWEWQIGDEVRVELFSNQQERRLILQGIKPAMGEVAYRIFNMTRADCDEFQRLNCF